MYRLAGAYVDGASRFFSSEIEGEQLEDTSGNHRQLLDAIVLADTEEAAPAGRRASHASRVVNAATAGAAAPTQALLDLYTIHRERHTRRLTNSDRRELDRAARTGL